MEITELDEFRLEIFRRKQEEAEQGETAHFEAVDPQVLTEEDQHAFIQCDAGVLPHGEFNAYRERVRETHNASRDAFVAYFANLLMVRDQRES